MQRKFWSNFDYWLVLAVMALSIFGIVCIGSATRINQGNDPGDFYSQILFFISGLVILVFVTFLNLRFFARFSLWIYLLEIGLLVLVLFLGKEVSGATRWFRVGPVSIQPSEFSKCFTLFCMAALLSKYKKRINEPRFLCLVAALTLLPVGLIAKQPSLSACLVILFIVIVQVYATGISYKIIGKVLAVAIPILVVCVWDALRETPLFIDKILEPHQMTRIITFFRPDPTSDAYYQTMKSINAIGSGQFSGKGLFGGTLNQLSYLPEPHNDFIFSVIGEEFGFLGCIFVLALLLFVLFRCILIAMACRDTFSQLIVIGVVAMIGFQTFVNCGVATGLMPNTGMSLPFVSYGGSSMWTNMAAIGLVLNIGLRKSRSIFEGG